MSWRDASMLWGLLGAAAVPLVFVAAARLRARAARAFGSGKTVGALIHGDARALRVARALAFTLGVAALVIGLAGPRFGSRTELLRKRGIDVVVALDFSKSMLAADVQPSRIERAKNEVRRLIAEQGGDRVGLVAFAGDTMEFPMTSDYSALDLFLRDLGPADMPVGGTAIGRALIAGQRLLERSSGADEAGAQRNAGAPKRDRVVVLLTDGEDHEGDPVAAAEDLKKAGIRVFTIGIGSRAGEPIPTYAADGTWTGYQQDEDGNTVHTAFSEAAENALKEVSKVTGGKFFRAEDGSLGMDAVRREFANLRQTEAKNREVRIYEEGFPWALGPAFFFLLLEFLLPEALFRRRRERARTRGSAPGIVPAAVALVLGLLGGVGRAQAWEPLRSENSNVRAGNEALRAKNVAGALSAYDKAARELPSEPGVHYGRGLALLEKGEFSKAREALTIATEPPANADLRARAHYAMGLAFLREGEASSKGEQHDQASSSFRSAAEQFKKSLRTKPGNGDAAWNYEFAKRRIVEEQKKAEQKKNDEQQSDGEQEKEKSEDEKKDEQTPDGGTPNQPDGGTPEQKDEPKDGDPKNDDSKGEQPKPDQNAESKNPDSKTPDSRTPEAKEPQGQPTGEQPSPPKPDPATGQTGEGEPAPPADKPSDEKPLPAHIRRALDALRDGERNLEQHRAQQRARMQPRRVVKDW